MKEEIIEVLPTLYSRSETGSIRHWVVEVGVEGYRTRYGQLDGKTTISKWYMTEATNVGRTNERSVMEQAIFEARAVWKKKVEAGYCEDVKCIDEVKFVKPMLADKWEVRESKVEYPVYSQPKLDGMRAVVSRHGAFTRNGKKWVTIPHIIDQLKPFFEKYPDYILDGELYNHEYKEDFNKICSLAKKTKPTAKDLEESSEKLQYWIYDIIGLDEVFSKRNEFLIKSFERGSFISLVVVKTAFVENKDVLDILYNDYMEYGYEGQMVRQDSLYENKRSKSLLKRKTFQDEEYRIISVEEGRGNKSGMAGYMHLEKKDGVQFRSNIKGTHEFLKNLFISRETIVGKWATCQFFNLTPDGIPRFPYVIKIRDGEGVD